ncbi:MAG: aminoacyl-tRNA hydrolase [Alphaproteobacteria bacterium]|nr:aminoacyl-tRNA hydrolase [Alphaproteobacteria bacterium]
MYVVVGLGNPGEKYSLNRHNIGFMSVDSIASAYKFPPFKIKSGAAISEGTLDDHKVILCKPMSYMNLSGQPVGDTMRFYKIPLDHVYVIHDDLDLDFGRVKVKIGGGSGGHNGLKSLDQYIGKDYWRIRLGIGHPGRIEGRSSAHQEYVSNYVLSNFSKDDYDQLTEILLTLTQEIGGLLGADPGVWLTKVAQSLRL